MTVPRPGQPDHLPDLDALLYERRYSREHQRARRQFVVTCLEEARRRLDVALARTDDLGELECAPYFVSEPLGLADREILRASIR